MNSQATQLNNCNNQLLDLKTVFNLQKAAFRASLTTSAEQRIKHIKSLQPALEKYLPIFEENLREDFSCRGGAEINIVEGAASLGGIEYHASHVKQWMLDDEREAPEYLQPAAAKVIYQPLGVVGIIVPWNYPIYLAIGPLLAALAAGNRVMIKMSEFTPATSESFKQMIAEIFTEDHVAVVTGGADVASKFTQLPFNHILFTGSTSVGKHVMRAAAENLTPVTLELGGKSPVLIHESFPTNQVAERIASCKVLNAGQTCIAPDYVLCQKNKIEDLIDDLRLVVSEAFPTMRDNDEYTAIVNERQFLRLKKVLRDAEDKGASIIPINPANEDFEGTRKMPLFVILNTTEDMLIEQDEIFGPLLPVKAYESIDDALDYINARPRPLALYYFDSNTDRADYVLRNTLSGGACINDCINHVLVDDMPFGGAGASGMGAYHGKEGFITFSQTKGVFLKGQAS